MNAHDIEQQVSSMLSGDLSIDEILAFFEAMEQDELTADHLVGGARAMRAAMVPVALAGAPIDTCGTGGSGKQTINTSTLTAFVVAAAGGQVAKHGNRSASGNCGCFDVLETLGARIELTPAQEQTLYEACGVVFLYARTHHPAVRFVAEARVQFGRKTLFNLLGPLCNPAGVTRQLVGTGNARDAELMSAALTELGTQHGLVVTGLDGLDEVSVCAPTVVREIPSGETVHFVPSDVGITTAKPEDIAGGNAEQNAEVVRHIASGHAQGPQVDLILVNAAHALSITPLADDLTEAFALARDTLQSGRVAETLTRYIECSQDVSS